MKRKKKLAALSGAVIGLASGTASADQVEYDHKRITYEDDWNGDGTKEWEYIEQYANATGDDELTSSSTDTPVSATQAASMALSYDDAKSTGFPGYQVYIPDTRNHRISVEVAFTPYDTSVRITDPFTTQQGEAEDASQVTELAIETLYNYAMDVVGLPLPSPFDLVPDEGSIEQTTRTSEKVVYEFNDHPDYQGVEWLARVNTPSKAGFYGIDVEAETDPGFIIDTQWAEADDHKDNTILLWADFEVYR